MVLLVVVSISALNMDMYSLEEEDNSLFITQSGDFSGNVENLL